jgi:hypothetical protein
MAHAKWKAFSEKRFRVTPARELASEAPVENAKVWVSLKSKNLIDNRIRRLLLTLPAQRDQMMLKVQGPGLEEQYQLERIKKGRTNWQIDVFNHSLIGKKRPYIRDLCPRAQQISMRRHE